MTTAEPARVHVVTTWLHRNGTDELLTTLYQLHCCLMLSLLECHGLLKASWLGEGSYKVRKKVVQKLYSQVNGPECGTRVVAS